MTRSVKFAQFRLPEKYQDLTGVFNDFFTKILAEFDIRNADAEFADGLTYDGDKIQFGNDGNSAEINGGNINSPAKLTTQRVMQTVTYANAGSVQNTVPLTASANSLTAEIQVGAHTLYYGGETVSFNPGIIVGLTTQTDYYVYADDPDLQGGAVTYLATTSYTNLAANSGRYYVGAIRTPYSTTSAALSAATNANPCEITTGANHNFATGNQVTFSGVGGMTELNALPATTITVTAANKFTLDGINATAYGVYTSGGTVTRVASDGLYAGGAGGGVGYIYDFTSYAGQIP